MNRPLVLKLLLHVSPFLFARNSSSASRKKYLLRHESTHSDTEGFLQWVRLTFKQSPVALLFRIAHPCIIMHNRAVVMFVNNRCWLQNGGLMFVHVPVLKSVFSLWSECSVMWHVCPSSCECVHTCTFYITATVNKCYEKKAVFLLVISHCVVQLNLLFNKDIMFLHLLLCSACTMVMTTCWWFC